MLTVQSPCNSNKESLHIFVVSRAEMRRLILSNVARSVESLIDLLGHSLVAFSVVLGIYLTRKGFPVLEADVVFPAIGLALAMAHIWLGCFTNSLSRVGNSISTIDRIQVQWHHRIRRRHVDGLVQDCSNSTGVIAVLLWGIDMNVNMVSRITENSICFFNSSFRPPAKNTPKAPNYSLCEGNPAVTVDSPHKGTVM